MISLLLLKQIYNLGDETVVSQWVHNAYWQYFSEYTTFQWKFSVEPSDPRGAFQKKDRSRRSGKDIQSNDRNTLKTKPGERSSNRYDSTRKKYYLSNRCKIAQKDNR